MQKKWHKYLTRPAPRYTSYPSALHFNAAVGAKEYHTALENIGLYEPISIYIHIPFCTQLCWYCGCNMRVENDHERARPYLDAVIAEITQVGKILSGRGVVSQIHFGGGTPNYFAPKDLRRILDQVEQSIGFTDLSPVCMELDPRLCTSKGIHELAAIGITRMSLGVQDFAPKVQEAINRVQSYEMIESCVSAMREAGIEDISFDLLYGLPLQKADSFADSLRKTISLSPERISLFGYAHLPEKILHQRLIRDEDLPSPIERAKLAALADEAFLKAGYQCIGFDHFAKPQTAIARAAQEQRLARNFQGFTEDTAKNVIGFGPSAISQIHGLLAQNAKYISDYQQTIASNNLATQKGAKASSVERRLGDWIDELLCRQQADLSDWYEIVAPDDDDWQVLREELQQFEADHLITLAGDLITIRPEARAFSRLIAAVFDPTFSNQQKDRSTKAFSRAI
jgi:oxygen-independent coproporphyrinogen III oxidase